MAKSKFIKDIVDRGYLHQSTSIDGLDEICSKETISGYIGFDCTADSLHVGSLTQIMMLRLFQKAGHRPIILMGGGTTKIGDPSGKDAARPLLSEKDILYNKSKIKTIFEKYLHFGEGYNDAIMIDNSEWLNKLELVKFLREYGRFFSVNKMLNMDSVKMRLDREQPLSLLEFNYAILQAYDFLELNRRLNCIVQMGGSDQWGNIITGADLTRRVVSTEVFGLTSPLIMTSSGQKMGKTAKGAIWLNNDKLDSWNFWQFWRNTEDKDVVIFLKLFTELPLDEINKLSGLKGAEINEAKIILANAVTKLCHGEKAAKTAHKTALDTFQKGFSGYDLPVFNISLSEGQSISLIEALCISGLCSSKGEAKRLIRGGGAKINNTSQKEEDYLIQINQFDDNFSIKLSSGKKNHVVITYLEK